ncbi:MAG: cytochrome c oxidase assembly protein [Gammaproteobacteria bacterium]|nr:cytochrome c oxidase assembly protein [Gammaproteobacteria bacterium]
MKSGNAQTAIKLSLAAVGMFAFAFALVPLYDLLCEVTGLNGRTGGAYTYEAAKTQVDDSRLVKVNFITNTNEGMVWKFWAESPVVQVHPGELTEVNFFVRNPTNRVMVAQAIPSLAPGNAAEFFHKTECFCFERQVLQPGEELEMPMRFLVAPELPKYVQSVSLSYSLFDITELAAADIARPDA